MPAIDLANIDIGVELLPLHMNTTRHKSDGIESLVEGVGKTNSEVVGSLIQDD